LEIQLSISNRMRIFLETASEFVNYSPGAGYSYIPDSLEKPTAPGAGSRTGSIIPGGTEGPQPTEEQHEAEFSDDFFMQSLNLTNRFGDEYMDENPLQGEPGSFVFQRTNAQIRAMHKAEEAAAANKAATGASSMTIRPQ
jgi:mediator of RNA polymerase II transcription subunit 6